MDLAVDENANDIGVLESALMADIAAAADEQAIEAVRVAALGKKGSVSEMLKTLGAMSAEQRQTMGPAINGLKNRVTEALTARRAELREAAIVERLAAEKVDVTLPVRPSPAERGRIHPISQVIDEITAIFGDLGFSVAEGPDIETDYYNFTALNFPEGHPAREMHDTFFFPPGPDGERKLLRTHTSPVQIRTMEAQEAADPHRHPGQDLPAGFRRDALADVPSGRRAGDRQDRQRRQHEVGARGILQGVLRSAVGQDALSPVLLPVHRAQPRGRHPVRPLAAGRDTLRRGLRLAGDTGLRHGAPQRAADSAGSTRTSIRASPGGWGSTASPC